MKVVLSLNNNYEKYWGAFCIALMKFLHKGNKIAILKYHCAEHCTLRQSIIFLYFVLLQVIVVAVMI